MTDMPSRAVLLSYWKLAPPEVALHRGELGKLWDPSARATHIAKAGELRAAYPAERRRHPGEQASKRASEQAAGTHARHTCRHHSL